MFLLHSRATVGHVSPDAPLKRGEDPTARSSVRSSLGARGSGPCILMWIWYLAFRDLRRLDRSRQFCWAAACGASLPASPPRPTKKSFRILWNSRADVV